MQAISLLAKIIKITFMATCCYNFVKQLIKKDLQVIFLDAVYSHPIRNRYSYTRVVKENR